jgi:hypothetical protein
MKCVILACAVFLAFARTHRVIAQVAGQGRLHRLGGMEGV